MGYLRKGLFLGTGGMSRVIGIRTNSKKERTAKATEKQFRLQRKMANPPRARAVAVRQDPSLRTTTFAEEKERQKERIAAKADEELRVLREQMETAFGGNSKDSLVAPSAFVADELSKLADLRDRGVLTDEEFAAQKAKLLG